MLPSVSSSPVGRLRLPAYVLLGVTATLPLVDLLVVAWPVRPSQLQWRFAAFGQLSGSAAAPLIALVLLYGMAYALGDRKMLYFCAALTAVYTAVLIAATGSFPLDSLQMRRRVPNGAGQSRFSAAAFGAEVRLILYTIGSLILTVSLIRSARMLISLQAPKADPSSSLVMRNLGGASRPTPAGPLVSLGTKPDSRPSPLVSPEE